MYIFIKSYISGKCFLDALFFFFICKRGPSHRTSPPDAVVSGGVFFFKRRTTLSYSIFDQELSEKSWKTRLEVCLCYWFKRGEVASCTSPFQFGLDKTLKNGLLILENGSFPYQKSTHINREASGSCDPIVCG